MRYLGVCYRIGAGLKKSQSQAREWFLFAAQAGDMLAAVNLGFMLEQGKGGPKDISAWGVAVYVYVPMFIHLLCPPHLPP